MFVNAIDRTDKLSPWRIGIAFGLAAGVKITSVYALAPAMLLAIPQARVAMRRLAIAFACAVVLAGPWYLRNWVQFGNPLFPVTVRLFGQTVFGGLFVTAPSPRLSELAGLREIFIDGYFSLGPALAVLLLIVLVGAALLAFRRVLREALSRVLVIGPIVGTIAFIFTSPYGEVRFLYPWLITAMLSAALWPRRVSLPIAVLVTATALATSFAGDWVRELVLLTLGGVVVVQVIRFLMLRSARVRVVTATIAGVFAVAITWINWRAYVESLPESANAAWQEKYGGVAQAWTFLRTQSLANQPIARIAQDRREQGQWDAYLELPANSSTLRPSTSSCAAPR